MLTATRSMLLATFAAFLLALSPGVHADETGAAQDPAGVPAGETTDKQNDSEKLTSEEATWKGFVKHLEAIDREDLLHKTEPARVVEEGDLEKDVAGDDADDEADVATTDEHADHDHGFPDFWKGDPMRPILFRLSKELVRLDALFPTEAENLFATEPEDPDVAAKAREKRLAKIAALTEKLGSQGDPYLRAYAKFYAAKADVESERFQEAAVKYRELLRSEHFLSQTDTHRELALVYQKLEDDTLAILELQFYLADLGEERTADRTWVEDQLKGIRDRGHEGPLHETVEQAESISGLIETAKAQTGEATPTGSSFQEGAAKKQREVEGILEKTIQLLESESPKCPKHASASQCAKASCPNGSKPGAVNRQRRLEEVLEKVIVLAEGSAGRCSTCGKKPCQGTGECKLVAGQGKGQKGKGKQKGQEGDPKDRKDPNNPAEDTKLAKEKAGKINRRDVDTDSEAWGRINDREVARSLRELWDKIPVAYRGQVAQYFKDITDLDEP